MTETYKRGDLALLKFAVGPLKAGELVTVQREFRPGAVAAGCYIVAPAGQLDREAMVTADDLAREVPDYVIREQERVREGGRHGVAWAVLAEFAETRRDWDHAAEGWFHAAQELQGNPNNLRTFYAMREDRAKAKALEARKAAVAVEVAVDLAGVLEQIADGIAEAREQEAWDEEQRKRYLAAFERLARDTVRKVKIEQEARAARHRAQAMPKGELT